MGALSEAIVTMATVIFILLATVRIEFGIF
jgi:hypothetical protein